MRNDDPSLCNKCVRIKGLNSIGPSMYVLMIDRKAAPGLDIAKTTFMELFPDKNPLDPQQCEYSIVEDIYCQNICWGI